jgi:putative membrane protein insertion efficiency factor
MIIIELVYWPRRAATWVALSLIKAYQWTISPLLGQRCRYLPSCSEYTAEAIQKYGLLRGAWKGVRRVARCHPWNPGGYDPP